METMVLERYILNAEAAFEREEYLEGMRLLEEALAIEPNYSKAHNHLGWVYLFQINDVEKAERHLKFALSGKTPYGAAYMHMSNILFNSGRYVELEDLLKRAMEGGVDRSFIYNEYGRIHETQGRMRKAVENYKKALLFTFDEKELEMIRDNIRRCRQKRWILKF